MIFVPGSRRVDLRGLASCACLRPWKDERAYNSTYAAQYKSVGSSPGNPGCLPRRLLLFRRELKFALWTQELADGLGLRVLTDPKSLSDSPADEVFFF